MPQPKLYSAHVVKRSVDGGRSFGKMVELGRVDPGAHVSPEGASFYHTETRTVLAMWLSSRASNTDTGLRLWQANSIDLGLTWSAPAPVMIHGLSAANVTANTHIAPDSGIELQHGPHKGRLLHVLILISGNGLDVVIYSDDVGWYVLST